MHWTTTSFLHILSLSFTWQCPLWLHLWKLAGPGQDQFLCLPSVSCFLWLRGPSGAYLQATYTLRNFFPFMAKILGTKAFSPWPTNDTDLRSTWQWLLCHLFWWLVIRLCIHLMKLSYWHHSFPRSKAINLFFTFFPEEIICKCLLGVFWQMCWSVVLHHWCFAVEF